MKTEIARNRIPTSIRRAAVLGALLLLAVSLGACQTPPPDDGVQVWVTGWPGSTTLDKSEAIQLRGADIRCGIGDAGELCFVPAQASNRIQFPDGSSIETEGIKLYLKRSDGNDSVGTGPYSLELLLRGNVKLDGPFSGKMEAWLGSNSEHGEALPLVSGKQKGPMAVRCPVTLDFIIANGRGMIFGSLKKPGVLPEEGPAKTEGTSETPPPEEGESEEEGVAGEGAAGESPDVPSGEEAGEAPAGEGEATPGDEGDKPADEGTGEKTPEEGSGG